MDSWKDWTPEQWRNAVFCPDCGLPLLEVEDEDPGIGHYMCVFCTWVEDIEDVHKSKIAGLEAKVERLRDALADIAHGPVGYWNEPQNSMGLVKYLVEKATKALQPPEVE